MTAFKFPPPPPPPPPKASSNDSQPTYPSQRGGHGQGRGDTNRGRGGHGRGGASSFGGNGRGGHGQAHGGRGSAYNRGGPRGGQQNNKGVGSQEGGSGSFYGQWQQPNPAAQMIMSNAPHVPTGAFTTTSFAAPPPVDRNTFVQAMSFMATPAGAQSMAAFASHMASAGSPPNAQSAPLQPAQQPSRYSPTQQAGQKRKWEERKPQQQGSKPPRAKAAAPPPIPTFGFTLPKPISARPSTVSKTNNGKDDRKGKVRLGLTHVLPPDESSSEDENVDEEVALAAKLKGGGFAFEHNGEHISLQTTGDVAEWIEDRRRNFPTQQKALEKAHAAEIKRRNELEFVRKLKGKPQRLEAPRREQRTHKIHERSEKDEKKQEELAALRKKLHESMLKKKDAPAAIDLGLGYGSETESDVEESSVHSESSVVSSSEESSDDSDADSEEGDAAPEPTSSKIGPPAIKVPPPAPTQTERLPDNKKMCKSWRQFGKCPFGHSCRFKHPAKEEKRIGLYEKLVEQELVKSDQLALDAIKFLGQNGFLG